MSLLEARLFCFLVCLLGLLQSTLNAQPENVADKASRTHKDGNAPSFQSNDANYTARIREYTTEPFFLTELVDHLPASDRVPSPEKILGYAIGTPDKLTYTKDIYNYYRQLEKASARVRVWTVGKSEEGREMLLVAISDETNMKRLERNKEITARLSDPRKLSEAEAQPLVREAKPFYWASGSIHSPETGSPEMLMELAYRIAVEETAHIQAIRKNVIFLITPVVEVDGRDRAVDLYNYRKANPGKPVPSLVYWGKYVAHDNNRDAIGMGLALSQVMMKTFLEWHPQVLHDLHESVPFLYTSTGTGPYNAWLDPIVVNEWQELAYYEIDQMTQRGVPGVWTHGFYDGWAANYMFYVANGHNSIGRFYETYGGTGADTVERTVQPGQTTRAWFRPNPPLPKVRWSIRNNINLQQSGLLFALKYMADHKEDFLRNFYLKSRRSIAKATTEGPAAWAILNDGKRPALAGQLAQLMQRQGAEVHVLDQEVEVKEKPLASPHVAIAEGGAQGSEAEAKSSEDKPSETVAGERGKKSEPKFVKVPAGSYIIRMDQPYSRMVDMLLDTQYYSTTDPRPYDDTGWTLGPLRNVKTMRVTDTAILRAPMTLQTDPVRTVGSVTGSGKKFYLVNANAEPGLATLRFRLKNMKFFVSEDSFEADGKRFAAGSFLIPTEGNPSDLSQQLTAAAGTLGLRVTGSDAEISAKCHSVGVPRLALMHSWVNTQNEGWFRLGLEEFEIPYSYISEETVRSTTNLKEKFDVLILPPYTSSLARMIHGVPLRLLDDGSDLGGPIGWRNTPLTPNLVGPDQSDDIRGGLGFSGLANLKKFVEDGGVFIPITSSASLPIELGVTESVSIAPARQLQARGGIYNAVVADKGSPITYGYDEMLAVYFNQGPLFRVSLASSLGVASRDEEDPVARPSGRGSASDPDVPQGRPWQEPEPRRSSIEQELFIEPELHERLRGSILPPQMWPRVVLRFAEEKNLWVSGMLTGASELANTPAVLDVPVGRGHVVLFANNPMWRQETHGSFMLLLNAALHFDHLHVGRTSQVSKGTGH